MSDLVIRDIRVLILDWRAEPMIDAWLLVEDGRVKASGVGKPPVARETLDARGYVLLPGFVAAHHHLYQGLSRGIYAPGSLIDWLNVHYRAWSKMSVADTRLGALVSATTALLGGCTTVAGFEYLHPPDEDHVSPVVEAADQAGIRLLYVRGCAPRLEGPLGERLVAEGVNVSRLQESADQALTRTAETLARPTNERLRWAAGPTTPVVDDGGDFHRELDALASKTGSHLHTHFHPIPGTTRVHESAYEMAERVGLVRSGNWLAHGSRLRASDVKRFGDAGVGIVHNPSCSALLGYPTPPLHKWIAGNDRIAISVDGAASNDRGGMLGEAQLAWQLQQARMALKNRWDTTRAPATLLDACTRGAAKAIGWQDVGTLEVGNLADFTLWKVSDIDFAGTSRGSFSKFDWLLMRCFSGSRAWFVFVGGAPVVSEGRVLGVDMKGLVKASQIAASRLYDIEEQEI